MRKALALALILTLCLAVTGVAYGIWGGDMDIDGTVRTGNVDVEWRYHGFDDNESCCGPCGGDWATVVENQAGKLDISDDGRTIFVVIDNAYPGYEVDIYLGLHNEEGTVPALIEEITYDYDPAFLEVSGTGDIFTDGTCLAPCHEERGTLTVKVLDGVEEDSEYKFTVTIDPGVQH